MSDTFREVTRVSWFSRLRQSVFGVILGLILVVAMVIGLFWNEGRAVTTARALAEGAGLVVSVASDAVDAGNEGRLVHVSGIVTADTEPVDRDFGISAAGIRLERTVEMYQWREQSRSETQTKLGGGQETVTTYTYSREWASRAIDSSNFRQPAGHANPAMTYRSEAFQIPAAKLDAFQLDSAVLDRIGDARPVPITPDLLASINTVFTGSLPTHVADGRIYLGRDPANPAIGDHRVSYALVPLGPISVVARQEGASFAPYQTRAGDRLLMVETGAVPAERMFERAATANTVMTWLLRLGGLLLLMMGFSMVLGPLGVAADVLPFLGRIVRMGTGTVAFVLAVLVGSVTIAVAWFWYRPLLAIGIVLAGVAIAWLTGRLGKPKPDAAPVEAKAD
jgi:hypothetical protein